MRQTSLLLCAALAVAGCRAKSSPEYYQAQGAYTTLVDRLGDDAYFDPQLEEILTRLKAVPDAAREGPQAKELVAKIEAERSRATAEKARSEAAVAAAGKGSPAPPPPPTDFGTPTAAPPEPEPEPDPGDAGPPKAPKPVAEMPLDDFLKWYGNCVTKEPKYPIPNTKDEGEPYAIKPLPDCEKALGGKGGELAFVFVDKKLRGQVQRWAKTEQRVLDAGFKPPPPMEYDAGTYDFLLIPGAPVPEMLRPKPPDASVP